jgi:cytochrome c biogenesis protein CcmG/thiol:disulfide interchange protein DsbE
MNKMQEWNHKDMKKNIGIAMLIVVLVMCALYQNQAKANKDVTTAKDEAPKANFLAPAFELPGLDGNNYKVGGQRDKLLLINFWASWCEPCHMEAEDLQSIYNTYKDRLDLYAINVTYLDSQVGAVDFVSEYELTFPTLLDVSGDVTRGKYRIDGYPTSFLINQAGIIVEAYFGLINKAELERHIKKLLLSGKSK